MQILTGIAVLRRLAIGARTVFRDTFHKQQCGPLIIGNQAALLADRGDCQILKMQKKKAPPEGGARI
jgi:hypothetical protein